MHRSAAPPAATLGQGQGRGQGWGRDGGRTAEYDPFEADEDEASTSRAADSQVVMVVPPPTAADTWRSRDGKEHTYSGGFGEDPRAKAEAAYERSFASGEDFTLPRQQRPTEDLRAGYDKVSVDTAIGSSNRGFQLLRKMGWNSYCQRAARTEHPG